MKKRILLIAALIVLALSIICTSVSCSNKNKKELYEIAVGQINAGNYVKAAESFAELGNYKDSKEKAWECFYTAEKMLEEKTNCHDAFSIFLSLSEANFKGAAEGAMEAAEYAVLECLAKKDHSSAEKIFDEIDRNPIFEYPWKDSFYKTLRCTSYSSVIRPEILLVAWGYAPYIIGVEDNYTIRVNNKTISEAFDELEEYYRSNYRIKYSSDDFDVYESGSDEYPDLYVDYSKYSSYIEVRI